MKLFFFKLVIENIDLQEIFVIILRYKAYPEANLPLYVYHNIR